jgi:hypothetical protein
VWIKCLTSIALREEMQRRWSSSRSTSILRIGASGRRESKEAIECEVDKEITATLYEAWWMNAFKGAGVGKIIVTRIDVSVTPEIRKQ